MKNTDRIDRKVDQTLKVLDDIQRAEPRPFFYTRLEASMQKQTEALPQWTMRPVLIWSGLAIIILLNIGMAISYSKRTDYSRNEQSVGSFAEEYGLTIDGIDSN